MTIPNIASASTAVAAQSPTATSNLAKSTATATATATAILADSSYSTSVGGKSYAGNVSKSNGTYTISVPNLPGATVSASSLSAAEVALNTRIDVLA
jgi:hypothetical protein